MKHERTRIVVKGIVQGVGFRPFVYSLARSLELSGFVLNSSDGVIIEIEGAASTDFVERLRREAPPLSQIMSIDVSQLPHHGYQDFSIMESRDEGSFTLISADVSVCEDCFRELLNKKDRRYLYPFINCTNCGPRYTITQSVPYDRPNTTMAVFKMCPDCSREYHSPEDRRFHAQPNACHVCGPRVELRVPAQDVQVDTGEDPIKETIRLLKEGRIVAVKGLGGFHLACDASNEEAVRRLRAKKRKSNKPFALMSPDVDTVRKFCDVTQAEEEVLTSNRRPIVLLRKHANTLPEEVSPRNLYIGFMLPYTPLHYLLFHFPVSDAAQNFDALVMTSGNIAEEPIVIDNDEAVEKLSGIADAFLVHNRDIFMRVDDTVVKMLDHPPILSFIRRSRGYVPDPILLHDDGPDVLGTGADIKNIFTLTKGSFAVPSQHIGDMENYETLQFFEESLENLKAVYRVQPVALAYDLHPMYLSTQWALRQEDIMKIPIQHHYAHAASVMAERGLTGEVIGVLFDGTGYGTDGNLWGGEFLIADLAGFKRAGHLRYIPLPGGEGALKEPWRIAISYIKDCAGEETERLLDKIGFFRSYGKKRVRDILTILDKRQFSPLSSGAGRLFDAISAMTGVCDTSTFEGEAAIALEAITRQDILDEYPFTIRPDDTIQVDFAVTVRRIIDDVLGGVEKSIISSKFHNTVVSVILQVVKILAGKYALRDVVLGGGVFQNMYVLERTVPGIESLALNVHIHDKVPTNDAGISLGQAYIIRERIKRGLINVGSSDK
jgi:hydrogenase maturation protein HypF